MEGAEGPAGCSNFEAVAVDAPRMGKGATKGIFSMLHTVSSSTWLSKGLAI
jgi:hypothetical protein